MNVKEILELDNDDPIKSFTGKVVAVYNKRTAGGKFPKDYQDIKVQDETGEMYLTFVEKNVDQDKSIVGKTITVNCSKSKDGSWIGVKKKIQESNGKEYRKIWVTSTAKVAFSGESSPAPSGGKSGAAQSSKMVHLTDEFIEGYAETWCHTYEIAAPIFKKAGLTDEQLPERITAILISAAYGQSFVIANKKEEEESEEIEEKQLSWKDIQVGKTKLGDLQERQYPAAIKWLIENKKASKSQLIAFLYGAEIESDFQDLIIQSVQKRYDAKKLADVKSFIKRNNIHDPKTLINALVDNDSIIEEVDADATLMDDDDEIPF